MIYFFHHYELPVIIQQARVQQMVILRTRQRHNQQAGNGANNQQNQRPNDVQQNAASNNNNNNNINLNNNNNNANNNNNNDNNNNININNSILYVISYYLNQHINFGGYINQVLHFANTVRNFLLISIVRSLGINNNNNNNTDVSNNVRNTNNQNPDSMNNMNNINDGNDVHTNNSNININNTNNIDSSGNISEASNHQNGLNLIEISPIGAETSSIDNVNEELIRESPENAEENKMNSISKANTSINTNTCISNSDTSALNSSHSQSHELDSTREINKIYTKMDELSSSNRKSAIKQETNEGHNTKSSTLDTPNDLNSIGRSVELIKNPENKLTKNLHFIASKPNEVNEVASIEKFNLSKTDENNVVAGDNSDNDSKNVLAVGISSNYKLETENPLKTHEEIMFSSSGTNMEDCSSGSSDDANKSENVLSTLLDPSTTQFMQPQAFVAVQEKEETNGQKRQC